MAHGDAPCLARAGGVRQRKQGSVALSATYTAHRRPACARVAVVVGTRPEAIKLAPLVQALQARDRLRVSVINSGQHAAAVHHMLAGFGIECDVELPALGTIPNLQHAVRQLRRSLHACFRHLAPRAVIVQGDTSSAYAGARAAHDAGVPVAHVEAGLRTDDIADPFPEEWFRRRIMRHARWHFAPCVSALRNLLAEGAPRECVYAVGNTGIDALRHLMATADIRLDAGITRRIVVTLHRRENWDANAELLCDALIALAARAPDVRIVFPVHPNPRIAQRIRRRLGMHPSFELVQPMEYAQFVRLVAGSALVISDSGGIQEEAPHLGTPLLVPRSNTERPECLATGFVELVPVEPQRIVDAALAMLARARATPLPFDSAAPFGAGNASDQIVLTLESALAPVVAHAIH